MVKFPNQERWRRANLTYDAKRKRTANARYRDALIDLLGGKCVKCGFSDKRALQVDHINGGGVKDIKVLSGNKNKAIMREILSGKTSKYQVLCANCNWIKRYENNETNNKFNKDLT